MKIEYQIGVLVFNSISREEAMFMKSSEIIKLHLSQQTKNNTISNLKL